MAAFNEHVYGSLVSPYMQVSRDSGYNLATIPQKFVSLFNDGGALFLAPGGTFRKAFPWLAITIVMMPAVLFWGSNILRLIAVIAVVHVAMYLAYGDLLPSNLFLYHLIHYFKLWIPYFGLIAVCGGIFLFQRRKSAVAAYVGIGGLALAIFLCGLGFRLQDEPIATTLVGSAMLSIEPAAGSQAVIDFIDFPDLSSDQPMKYVGDQNHFVADGKLLRRLGDVHLFKGPTFTRAFFTNGLSFRKLDVSFDPSFKIPADVSGQGKRYRYGWLQKSIDRVRVVFGQSR